MIYFRTRRRRAAPRLGGFLLQHGHRGPPELRQHLQRLLDVDAIPRPLNFFNGMPSFRNWVALACTVDFRSFVFSATWLTLSDFSQVSMNCCTVGRDIMLSALFEGMNDRNQCIIRHRLANCNGQWYMTYAHHALWSIM